MTRIHEEQVLEAHMSDQVTAPAAAQGTPADIPQHVITDNPLDKVKIEFQNLSEHLTRGTLDDFPYNHLAQHMAAETLWSLADPPLCKTCSTSFAHLYTAFAS